MRPWTNKSVGLAVLGLLLIILGTSLYFCWPALFQHILQKEMPLRPSSKVFELWKDTSGLPPMHLKIYFFNWTNPEDLQVAGTKPNLVQLGPYAFREVREKVNVTFHPDNHTVSYYIRRFWYFDESQSNGSLSDNITQLNVVAISAAHKTRYWQDMMQNTLSFMLSSSKVYTVRTVDELLFTGHDDTLLKLGRLAVADGEVPPFDRFGWFYTRNGSSEFDGHYNMDTGEKDIRDFGVLRKWNFKDTTKFYKSPCNLVEGSAGEFWPPNRQKDEINLFSADLCRPLTYEYVQTTTHMGVEGYQYALGEKTLGNDTRRRYPHDQAKYFEPTTTTEDFFDAEPSAESTDMPEEDPDIVNMGNCYCNGKCTPAGLMNITACRYGAPAFVSLPHFYKADPSLRDQVTGMNPKEDYDFYITLEPTTGIPLEVSAKLQVNILLQPSKTVSLFRHVPTIYFPIFWFSLKVEATEELTADLKNLLSIPSMCMYAGLIMTIIGCFLLLTVALLYVLKRQRASTIANDKNAKVTRIPPVNGDKSELMYLDKGNANEDPHVRSDRRLYPSSIECFNMDLQSFPPKLQHRCDRKSGVYD